MPTVRKSNLLGNQRVDVPTLRAMEDAVSGDFDLLCGKILAGELGYVVKGFQFLAGSVGNPATQIQVNVAGSAIIHPLATESGTIFNIPVSAANDVLNSSNARVSGSFIANTTNFIGIDLFRSADASTTDTVQFYTPSTKNETSADVPLARTLDYTYFISTKDFSQTPGLLPLAKVVVDSSGNVVSIQDARPMFGRLASGGSAPDEKNAYPWPGGRTEAGNGSLFTDGDRVISSVKELLDAMRTRLWETGGGEYWYSATADRNVRLIRTGSPIASSGDWFAWDNTNVTWQGLKVVFDNSTGHTNDIIDQTSSSPGLTDMVDGDCLYVDLDRTQNRTNPSGLQMVKTQLSTLGTPVVPGARLIILWRVGTEVFSRDGQWKVNLALPPATTTAIGTVKLNQTPGSASAPVVPALDANGTISVISASATAPAITGTGLSTSGATPAGTGQASVGGANSSSGNGGTGDKSTGGNAAGAGTGGTGYDGTGGTSGSGVGGNGVHGAGGAGGGGDGSGGKFDGGGTAGHGVVGNGATNGNGLVGTGLVGVQGKTNSSSGAAGDLSRTTSSIEAPLLTFSAESGATNTLRNYFTQIGYQTSKIRTFNEEWFYANGSNGIFPGVVDEQGAPGTVASVQNIWQLSDPSSIGNTTMSNPTSGFMCDTLLINHTGHPSARLAISTIKDFLPAPSFVDVMMQVEFDVKISNTAVLCFVGIADSGSNYDTAGHTAIGIDNTGGTNWSFGNGNGTSYSTTGMTAGYTITNMNRIRFEIYGANTNAAGNRVKIFVNDALKGTFTTTFGSSPCRFVMAMKNTTGGTIGLTIGPISATWNKYKLS